MRTDTEMTALILEVARRDERVRAVLLGGSRVDPQAIHDRYSDFDVAYYVRDLPSFIRNPGWIDVFGQRLILQCPDDWHTHPYDPDSGQPYAYLMQFADGARIDLTLVDAARLVERPGDPEPYRVLMDKDGANLPDQLPGGLWHIRRPSEQAFRDTCNEFWWLSVYVAKGLCREEFLYAKHAMEALQLPMLLRVMGWRIGLERGFSVSLGKDYKYLGRYLPKEEMAAFMALFAPGDYPAMWREEFALCDWFARVAPLAARGLGYRYDEAEGARVRAYVERMKEELR